MMLIQGLPEALRAPKVGVDLAAVVERIYSESHRLGVVVHEESDPVALGDLVS